MSDTSIKQHTVSQVVLRNFAPPNRDTKRRQLAVYDKATNWCGLRSTKTVFVQDNFTKHEPLKAESLWGRLESSIPRAYHELKMSKSTLSPQSEEILRGVLALHWSRSAAVRLLHDELAEKHLNLSRQRVASTPGLLEGLFHQHTGLIPVGPESLAVTLDRIYVEVETSIAVDWSERLAHFLDKARTKFQSYRVQVGFSRRPNLVIGDCPVITTKRNSTGVGPHQGIALNDASQVLMPVSPNHLIALGPQSASRELSEADVSYFNGLQVDGSIRWIGASPESDFGKQILARSGPFRPTPTDLQ